MHFSCITYHLSRHFYSSLLAFSPFILIFILILSSISPSFSFLLVSSFSLFFLRIRNCKSLTRNCIRYKHVASANVGAEESASRTCLRDGTCANAIFHHSRKVCGGICTLRNQGDTRHRNYFRVSRGHNSGDVCLSFYIFFVVEHGGRKKGRSLHHLY